MEQLADLLAVVHLLHGWRVGKGRGQTLYRR